MHNKKILFIVKRRHLTYPSAKEYGETNASGLFNSVRFIVDMLKKLNVECEIVQVNDNNDIDREVTKYRPDIVMIEALWVVPEKFAVLHKLHPKVQWIIRLHSETPFIANEGIAMSWLFGYQKHYPYVRIAANAPRMLREVQTLLKQKVLYLPNTYPVTDTKSVKKAKSDVIHISCFGAVRPLKNHLSQALAAIEFAESIGKKLHFHINATRIEGKGDPILKNLQQLFQNIDHTLVEHPWMAHDKFVELVKQMDLGMQVSFTETYNIVAADHVNNNIPVVTSDEVKFVNGLFHADPTETSDMVCKLYRARWASYIGLHHINKWMLTYNSYRSGKTWLNELCLKHKKHS